ARAGVRRATPRPGGGTVAQAVCVRRHQRFAVASTASSTTGDRSATTQPAAGGAACSSASATGGIDSTRNENTTSTDAQTMSRGFVVQPSAPAQRVELRQAKALAVWAKTTVMNAAPDAAARSASSNGSPGRHPTAT